MQKISSQVLKIQPATIGLDDSCFQLSSDSLAAMKVVDEMRKIGFQLVVADIFRHPKLQHVASQVASTSNMPNLIPKMEQRSGPVEQSFAQERLWFLEQLHPGLDWYLCPLPYVFEGLCSLMRSRPPFWDWRVSTKPFGRPLVPRMASTCKKCNHFNPGR